MTFAEFENAIRLWIRATDPQADVELALMRSARMILDTYMAGSDPRTAAKAVIRENERKDWQERSSSFWRP